MIDNNNTKKVFVDASRLITEACVQAGADVFIGYPITPANLLYSYAVARYPEMMAAPDEITTLQWMSGFAAAGKIPVTATSFPGYALMIESIGMAHMMELPMVIILVQRLGPATGTATCGAQGDISVVHGSLSGGYQLPTLCASNYDDCWTLAGKAVHLAAELRSPVVLLTSKEMIMTLRSYDWSHLPAIEKVKLNTETKASVYKPYAPQANLVPEYLPYTQNKHQVRITASTHNQAGILQNVAPEALDNSRRLQEKMLKNLDTFTYYDYDKQDGAETLLLSMDVSSQATREAAEELRKQGKKVSVLIAKTLFPIPQVYLEIAEKYKKVVVVEENLDGQYRKLLFGYAGRKGVSGVNGIGKMISPNEIMEGVNNE